MSTETFGLRVFRPGPARTYRIHRTGFLVGSGEKADLQVAGFQTEEGVLLEPSSDGTIVATALGKAAFKTNGKKAKKQILQPGDRLEIQEAVMVLDTSSDGGRSTAEEVESDLFFPRVVELMNSVGSQTNLQVLLNRVLDDLLKIPTVKSAFIILLDAANQPKAFVSSDTGRNQSSSFSNTIVQSVLQSGEPVRRNNVLKDPEYGMVDSIYNLKLSAVLCTPVTIANRLAGVVYLASSSPTDVFGDRELQIAQLYSTLCGMLVNHAEYISQQRAIIGSISHTPAMKGIIAHCRPMQSVLTFIASVAKANIPILIDGETGTGKDVIARYTHEMSDRSDKPFVVVNCSSLRQELLDSELFGHRRGSFTGAVADHQGLFENADGGTIFLDEIGELDIQLQAKLLRTLETGYIRPVGSSSEKKVDARIICATNRDLSSMVTDKEFREDLYYRLNHFHVTLPPLRDRGEDIIHLAYFFLDKYSKEYSKDSSEFDKDALAFITSYEWPGNIREMGSTVHRAVLTSHGGIVSITAPQVNKQDSLQTLEKATRLFQRKLVRRAVDITGGNKEEAARLLGIHRSTLFRILAEQ